MEKVVIRRKVVAMMLMMVALMAGQRAWAVSTFTVEATGNGNTFKIKRSDTSKEETIKYYTISLSAFAGVHFTDTNGEYTFPVGIESYSVEVPETPVRRIEAKYLYYSGSGHTYRFLVTDKNGYEYAHLDRTLTYNGYAITSSTPFGVKDVTIYANEYTADDAGYDDNGFKSVASSFYFNQSAPKGYFSTVGAQLRMTLSMDAKENDDAYEYLQLLINDTINCDDRQHCSDGDPGNISLSRYMAGFEMKRKSKDGEYKTYTFPVLDVANGEGAENPWGYNTSDYIWRLSEHKFNTNCRATDGRIIIPTSFNKLVLRLNASGSSGSDEWAAKNVKAHIQAVDATAPTLESITLAGGTYVYKTSCYISLVFSEPVVVTGTPYLDTTWDNFNYLSGSGTNVLTFYNSKINTAPGTTLKVNSLSNVNAVKDLAGNAFSGSVSQTFSSVSVQKNTLYDDYVKFNDLYSSYPVSNTPAEPKPTIGFYYGNNNTILTLNTHYTRTYSNNTENDIVPGTGIITITGMGDYTGTASAEFNTRWATSRIIFKKNHNGSSITMTDQIFTYNVPQALKANSMTRDGYLFISWNTEADGSGTSYADEEVITNPSSTGTFTDGGSLTLYAQWSKDVWDELNGANGSEEYPYVISTTEGLDSLAARVNRGMTYNGKKFILSKNIAYEPTTNWNDATSTENNYTSIGNNDYAFGGIFDGQGYTVRGIRIYKGGDTDDDCCQGLFACNQQGTIQNVTLADARITGYACVGGIAGDNGGVIENCHVADNVVIHAVVDHAGAHGGIVGLNSDRIRGCTSAAHLTVASGLTDCESFGGIVGENQPNLKHCLALVATVDIGRNEAGGAIAGRAANVGNVMYNYYHGCTVGDETSNIGAGVQYLDGVGNTTTSGDIAHKAEQAYTVTLPEDISVSSNGTVTATYTSYENAPGVTSYSDGIEYAGTRYFTAGTTVTLSGADTGYVYTVNGTAIEGNTFEMPAEDVTVSLITEWANLNAKFANASEDSEQPTLITLNQNYTARATDTYLSIPSGKYVTLDLNGHTIDRNLAEATTNGYVIMVNGSLTINDSSNPNTGTITGGNCSGSAGGVYVKGGTLAMNGGAISGNTAKNNGGVTVANGSTFTLSNGIISNNTATGNGGGVAVYANCVFTMTGGTISDNSASSGGGVYVYGSNACFTMQDGTISNNSATNGGGVYVEGNNASFTMQDGTISNNDAERYGGGVYVYSGTFNISGNPVITGNTKNGEANNVYLSTGKVITVTGELTNTANIGVTTAATPTTDNPVVFNSGLSGNGTATNFTSDSNDYRVRLNSDGEAELYVPTFYTVSIADGITDGTVVASMNGNAISQAAQGDIVTLTITPPTGYAIGTVSYNDGSDHEITPTEGVYSFTMPASNVTVKVTWTVQLAGDGTAENPYKISNYAELKEFANIVNRTNSNACAKLVNDIQCKNSSDDTEYATDWECIGNNSHKYTGTFDGQDYTITGLSTPTDNSSNYVGLFGYIDGGSVSHLILDGATIKGYRYVSGIAGNIKNATLTNCFVVNSSITTTYTGGGQRGVIAGDYQGSTSNCSDNYYLNCTVNGSNNNIGAYNNDRAWASRVLAITLPDNVTATGKSITYDGTTYYSTLNSNTITLHYEGTVPDGQVAVFTVTSSYKSKVETTYTSDTFQMKTNIVDCTVSMAFIEAYILTLESGIVATGMKTTIDGNEYYPSGYPVTLSCPDFAVGCTIVYSVNGTPIEGDTFEMPAQDVTVTATITDLWGLAEGANGSEANPYVITTPEGLQLLSTYVEEENDANGMYFQLGADIDMSGVTDFIPIGWSSSFSGTFDGAGHTISHLTIDMGDSDDIGLFGQNNGSTIRNLTLDGATITGSNQVGGIAGGGNDSSITNCHVISSVIRGDSSVGAIVGFLFEGNDLVGNTYHSTLVYGGTDNGFHDGGDAFNIGVGFYFDDNWDFYDGDVEDCFELDATKLFLGDSCDNSDLIAAYADPDNHTYNYADAPDLSNLEVTLQGRTLWKDGGWNTLCLPFDVDPFANTPLEGATVKTLSSSSFAGGTLTLNFTDATSIEAGKPYIVKWADGTNIVNPVFTNLTVTNALTDIETDIVDFVGTYDQISFGWEENRSVLLMGGNSKLFYPDGQGQTWLNACRGYFRLHEGYVAGDPNDPSSGIKFVLNFDGDATGIENTEGVKETDDVWYDLSGRKIEGRPTVPGVYIHDGRKVLIK